ncbi:lipase [Kitasatospora sp. MMS16-BH015]|uniref:esterase/lipase family protein n=1 Tax=Kitasatospora sp. MMS16-BH015 TaxID=2018025 RepID=UPI000CA158B6|nr:lipase [Kitasatospora sp. MMS16-BH015]AUG82141.1 lipase [Kitasatospora sp. MMS16-BH015]
MRRTVPTALATLATTALLAASGAVTPARADTAVPVVFVHGRNADGGVWGTAISRLEARGYPADRLFTWSYDTSASTNETLAGQLSAYVDGVLARTGATRVDLVAHSLGSLPTRWYAEYGNGARTVRNWISLAGPNHGTNLAWACALWDQGCRDMTPGSYVVSHLNANGETPGPVHYWTFWSSCDEQILPATSTPLAGAVNTQAACLKHNDFLSDPTVLDRVGEILAAG